MVELQNICIQKKGQQHCIEEVRILEFTCECLCELSLQSTTPDVRASVLVIETLLDLLGIDSIDSLSY